ncbi:hypothetical protein NSQ59_27175 [Margalitia sp. FSL K6-0131]|uniref:hypothetical protein n=1 Tax=Margalitia sp. FSL K6-0131 TaxID=2954604 RepID=UPI0030F9E146
MLKRLIMWIVQTFFGGALVEFYFSLQSEDFNSMTVPEITHFLMGCQSLKVAVICGTLSLLMLVSPWIKKKFQTTQSGIKMKFFNFIDELVEHLKSNH